MKFQGRRVELAPPPPPTHTRPLVLGSFALRNFDGVIDANEEEVSAVRFVTMAELEQEVAASPDTFTPWLRHELQLQLSDLTLQPAAGL